MMRFKTPFLESQFHLRTHPELRLLLVAFEVVSPKWGLPAPVLTCLGRTPAENKAVGGVEHSLHLWEPSADVSMPTRTRAADLSIHQYDAAQLELVMTWFLGERAKRGGRRAWEILKHAVPGGAQHLHVGKERDLVEA